MSYLITYKCTPIEFLNEWIKSELFSNFIGYILTINNWLKIKEHKLYYFSIYSKLILKGYDENWFNINE